MNRGDIFAITIHKGTKHEQHGPRFAVILQSDALLPRSVVLIAPTSKSAQPASIRPEITVQKQSTRVLLEQMSAISVERLGKRVGRVNVDEQWSIDDAIVAVLGLD